MQDSSPLIQTDNPNRHHGRWYLSTATMLLLLSAFFRLWMLGTAPPGLSTEELNNAQLSNWVKEGNVSVIYDEVTPAREGLYYAYLAIVTTVSGQGTILFRLPSVWLAMLSLAMTARLMRQLFGVRVSLMALGLMGVTFWPVWMGRAVLHVTLMPLVTTVVIYTFARAFMAEEGNEGSMWFTLGGLALGVAQYIHVTAWTLVVLFLAFVAYQYLTDRQSLREQWGNIVYALVLAAILYLPLLIFTVRNPGIRGPVPLAEQPSLLTEVPGRLISSIAALALHGDVLPDHNLPGRPVIEPVLAVLMVTGIGTALARWRHPAYGMSLLWLTVGLLPTAFLPHKPDFEFMAVILPVIFVFPAMGLKALYQMLRRRMKNLAKVLTTSSVSMLVAALIIWNGLSTYRDYFLIWPNLGDVRLAYNADLGVLAHYLDTLDEETPVSICSIAPDYQDDPLALSNEDLLPYLMHRRNLPIRYFDCRESLVLANGGESQLLIFPREHYYDHLPGPLLAWMRYAVDEQVPGLRPDVVMRLDAHDALADQVGAFITTAPTAWPPESGDVRLIELPVNFAENVSFLGYSVRDDSVRSTDWVEMTTFWRVDGPPPSNLTLFAHLLGNPVVVIAQADSLGVEVETLQPRDVFLQYSMIQTPGRMAPGLYSLSVGLYHPDTQTRLYALENGTAYANRLFLQRVDVRP